MQPRWWAALGWPRSVGCALVVCAVLPLATAADRNDQFAAVGAGVATCERFLDVRAARSNEYFMLGGWIDGYLTARNQVDPDTFTLVPWQSTDVLAGFLADYCQQHTDQSILRALMVMTEALRPHRLDVASERIAVTVGPFRQEFFREVLTRIHKRLSERGYAAGPATGTFDETTAAALERFQQDQAIPVSGFPDQLTLFRLFLSESAD